MREPKRAAAVLAAALITLAAACVPPTTPTDFSRCPTADAGQVRVAIVVDSSTLPGGSANPSVVCVVVPSGSTGVDALAARAARIGATPPRFGSSGLLCGIDGAPAAPDCGTLGPDGYQYWGYYVGGSAWDFAPVGPASRVMTDGTVEGWAFQNGSNGGDPRTSASFTALTGA